jgi:hypothetical protein
MERDRNNSIGTNPLLGNLPAEAASEFKAEFLDSAIFQIVHDDLEHSLFLENVE